MKFCRAAENANLDRELSRNRSPRVACTTDPNKSKFRKQRFEIVLNIMKRIISSKSKCDIIDLGGTYGYWQPFLPQLRGLNIKVRILNLEDRTEAFADDRFSFERGDATNLPAISDRTFDLVHSNSLIEHVGRWTDMKRMAANVRRLADNYYIQTPYFWFPMEPHSRTIGYQWMPPQWRVKLLLRRSLGFYPMAADIDEAMDYVEGVSLLDKNQFKALFPDGRIISERVWGLTKSLIAVRSEWSELRVSSTEATNPGARQTTANGSMP
jgi:SAM-dependent methyltransferase